MKKRNNRKKIHLDNRACPNCQDMWIGKVFVLRCCPSVWLSSMKWQIIPSFDIQESNNSKSSFKIILKFKTMVKI